MKAQDTKLMAVFSILFIGICLLPFVGMIWAPDEKLSDTDERVQAPELVYQEGQINLDYLEDAGSYFENHFAYRNVAIDANAHIQAGLFNTSPTDQVIVGNDGWLYYGGTLHDYLQPQTLTERKAQNIAHNLSLMQGYVEAQGSDFLFTIAPNKNSLYPQHMPYYYLSGHNESMALLKSCMDEKEIHYLNLFDLFEQHAEELYFRTDTHWNNDGALLVVEALLEEKGINPVDSTGEKSPSTIEGDIERMLYPVSAASETTETIDAGTWEYANDATSVEDASILTSGQGERSLVMYSDSFANNLIPLLAPHFHDAYFSKLVPYDFMPLAQESADLVVVERAQRHVDYLAEKPPFLPAPKVKMEAGSSIDSKSSLSYYSDGELMVLEGFVEKEVIDTKDSIFVKITSKEGISTTFVPFHISQETLTSASNEELDTNFPDEMGSDYGFRMFVNKSVFAQGDYSVNILLLKSESGEVVSVLEEKITH